MTLEERGASQCVDGRLDLDGLGRGDDGDDVVEDLRCHASQPDRDCGPEARVAQAANHNLDVRQLTERFSGGGSATSLVARLSGHRPLRSSLDARIVLRAPAHRTTRQGGATGEARVSQAGSAAGPKDARAGVEYGQDIAIDASDLSAYANGQRYLSKHGRERERFSDPPTLPGATAPRSAPGRVGASTGASMHAAVCARTDLPVAWHVATARTHEASQVEDLLNAVKTRGFAPETVALAKGYDVKPAYEACEQSGCQPIIPLRQTPAVKRGAQLAPECEHGTWTFAGADFPRKRTKWRCPTGGCSPKSLWRKASRLHPLILYRVRAAVELRPRTATRSAALNARSSTPTS